MMIPIASDHAGYKAKEYVKKVLEDLGHMPIDFGTHSEDSVDYADFAVQVARDIQDGNHELGILICGSGQGMCMTANKFQHIRAALVYDKYSAEMTRRHNNANILCLPGRQLEEAELKELVSTWLNAKFEGGRHERRINKIDTLTDNQ